MQIATERDIGSDQPEPDSNEQVRPNSRVTIADLLAMPGIKDIDFEINRSKELVKPANLPD